MTPEWLHRYLVETVERRLCTKIVCTTCGAMEFRRGLLFALTGADGQTPEHFDREACHAIARALAGVEPVDSERHSLQPPVRCLLFTLLAGMPIFDGAVESILKGSWAGEVLDGMKAHDAIRREAWEAHEGLQKKLRSQKAERLRLKAERHQTRLEEKKVRDRLWREKARNTEKG